MTELLAIPRVAEQLDCSRGHVYGLIAAGELSATNIGTGTRSKTRVPAGDVEALIERRTRNSRKHASRGT